LPIRNTQLQRNDIDNTKFNHFFEFHCNAAAHFDNGDMDYLTWTNIRVMEISDNRRPINSTECQVTVFWRP